MTETASAAPRAGASTLSVAAGLGIFGLAGFVFLGLAGRDLGPAASAPLTVAWTALNAIGIGLFLPVEQEGSRLVAGRRRLGRPAPSLWHVGRYVALSGAIALLVALLAAQPLADAFFGGDAVMAWLVAGALCTLAVEYLVRGALSGAGHFGAYGAQLAVDGLVRIGIAVAVFVSPGGDARAYGVALVLAPLVATLATVAFVPHRWLRAGPVPEARAPLTALVATSLSAQLLANLGPLVIVLIAPDQPAVVGNFVAATTIARMPLFVFQAVQAVFLPRLATEVAARDRAGFWRGLRHLLAAVALLGVGGLVAIGVLGGWVLGIIYGPTFAIAWTDLMLLAASGVAFMVAQALGQGLLAQRRDHQVLLGWLIGLAVTVAALLLPLTPTTRVAVALILGSSAAAATLGIALARSWPSAAARHEGQGTTS